MKRQQKEDTSLAGVTEPLGGNDCGLSKAHGRSTRERFSHISGIATPVVD